MLRFDSRHLSLANAQDDFVENARLLIFETYCRIHQCIDLQMLADKLNMDPQVRSLPRPASALFGIQTYQLYLHACIG